MSANNYDGSGKVVAIGSGSVRSERNVGSGLTRQAIVFGEQLPRGRVWGRSQ